MRPCNKTNRSCSSICFTAFVLAANSLTSPLQVAIGGRVCRIASVNDSAISCTVGPGTPGTAAVAINVQPEGFAAGNLTVRRDFTITSISPALGSLAGSLLPRQSGCLP